MKVVQKISNAAVAGVFLLATLLGSIVTVRPTYAFAGGDGSEEAPWQISDCEEFQDMNIGGRDDHYIFVSDIDCDGVDFEPINFGIGSSQSFRGVLDGEGYTIRNVTIDGLLDAGLFRKLEGATVRDLTIENFTAFADSDAGSLAAEAESGTYVQNVHVTSGSIENSSNSGTGGLVGRSEESEYYDVSAAVAVSASTGVSGGNMGGLIGLSELDTIERAAADGAVTGGSNDVGGLIGDACETSIFWAHAKGAVVAAASGQSVGGLVGSAGCATDMATVYATGAVSGGDAVGGLVGFIDGGSLVSYAYSSGEINMTSDGQGGGLIGVVDNGDGDVTVDATTFWDTQTSGFIASAGDGEVGKTTTEMKTLGTFTDVEFDFEDVPYWGLTADINTGYPCHRWEEGCVIDGQVTPEGDHDGVSDGVENGAPNGGDGNNDGTADSEQASVASLRSLGGERYITLAVDASCSLTDVAVTAENSHSANDSDFEYGVGFVNFTATGCDNDETAMTLFYHGVSAEGLTVRKYNPNTGTYFTISQAQIGQLTAPLSGSSVTYLIRDNEALDVSPEAGTIVDPVGLGARQSNLATSASLASTGQSSASYLTLAGVLVLSAAVMLRRFSSRHSRI